MMRKKVFVTGGGGFVGSNLVKMLLSRNHTVLVYDDFTVGRRTFLPPENEHLLIKHGDILDSEKLALTLASFEPDIVVHLAAVHYIPYCRKYPHIALETNLVGTQNLLSACPESVSKIVFASSAAVYPISNSPHKESDSISLTDIYGDIYGTTKATGEILVRHYAESDSNKTSCVALRFFNVVGPNETNPHLLPHIFSEMSKGDTIHLGNIESKRDFIHVDDICTAIIASFEHQENFDVFNVGSGNEFSAEEIVNMLSTISNRKLEIISKENRKRKNDRMHLVADITKINENLNWEPQVSLERGLERLYADLQS